MPDVAGVGANSVDYVYRLPAFPQPDSETAKLQITAHAVRCGGQTATTLCTCAAMGLRTRYVGATGHDANGARMRQELDRRGVDITHAHVRPAENPFAVILLDERQGERVVLWSRSPEVRLRPEEINAAAIGRPRLLHVDDADQDAAILAAALANDLGIPVTSDIERVTERTEELVAAVTIPIFAEHALEPLTGERDPERALRAVQRLRARLPSAALRPGKPGTAYGGGVVAATPRGGLPATRGHGIVVVTLGARGAMLLDDDRPYHEPAFQVQVADTTGAGDVFRGAFIAAWLRGDRPADLLRFANAAAAISCTRPGAIDSVPTREEALALAGPPGA